MKKKHLNILLTTFIIILFRIPIFSNVTGISNVSLGPANPQPGQTTNISWDYTCDYGPEPEMYFVAIYNQCPITSGYGASTQMNVVIGDACAVPTPNYSGDCLSCVTSSGCNNIPTPTAAGTYPVTESFVMPSSLIPGDTYYAVVAMGSYNVYLQSNGITAQEQGCVSFTVPLTAPYINLNKVAQGTTANVGTNVLFTIYYNAGNVHNFKITDAVDSRFTIVSVYDGGTAAGQNISWTINSGYITSPVSGSVSFLAQVNAGTAGTIIPNTAAGSSTEIASANSNIANVTIGEAGLTVSKSVSESNANTGDTITYTLNYTNEGTTLVDYANFDNGQIPSGWTNNPAGGTWDATPGYLEETAEGDGYTAYMDNNVNIHDGIYMIDMLIPSADSTDNSGHVDSVMHFIETDSNDFFMARINASDQEIHLDTAATQNVAASAARPHGMSINYDTWYTMEVEVCGSNISMMVYPQGGTPPSTWDLTTTSTYMCTTCTGAVGVQSNNGPAEYDNLKVFSLTAATNPVAFDTVPTGISYLGCNGTCSETGNMITWALGSTCGGATSVSWWGKVTALCGSNITNTAGIGSASSSGSTYSNAVYTGIFCNPTPTPTFTITKTMTPTITNTYATTMTNTPTVTLTRTSTSSNTVTPSPTFTSTNTPTRSNTSTNTATPSGTVTSSPTSTSSNSPTRTNTPSSTNTPSPTPSGSPTITASPSPSSTASPTRTNTLSPTYTYTNSPTPTFTSTFTYTFTVTSTPSPTYTGTNSPTRTNTSTLSNTPTLTNTLSPTSTSTPSPTSTVTATRTNSPSPTSTSTVTSTCTFTTTDTPTSSITPTYTITLTYTPVIISATITPTYTVSPTVTITSSSTSTRTSTYTPTSSLTQTNTITSSMTSTPSPTSTNTPTYTCTLTSTSTYTITLTFTPPIISATITPTYTASPTMTYTGTSTDTATNTASSTASDTVTPSYTMTFSPTSTNTIPNPPTLTDTPTASPTYTLTSTFTVTDTLTDTQTCTQTSTFTPTYTNSPVDTSTDTPTNSPTLTVTATFTGTPTQSYTRTDTLTSTQTPTYTATPTLTNTLSPTGTYSQTVTYTCTFTYTGTYTFTPSSTTTLMPSITSTPNANPTVVPKVSLGMSGDNPKVGAKITFTLIVDNTSNTTISNISVWDSLPGEVSLLGVSLPSQPTPVVSGNYIEWNLTGTAGTLQPGQSLVIQFTVTLNTYNPSNTLISNVMSVDYNDPFYNFIKHPPLTSNVMFYPIGKVEVYPNPYNPNRAINGTLKFVNVVPGTSIQIYTVSGELVDSITANDIVAYWNGKNRYGEKVSAGIYYFVITNIDGTHMQGKIFLLYN